MLQNPRSQAARERVLSLGLAVGLERQKHGQGRVCLQIESYRDSRAVSKLQFFPLSCQEGAEGLCAAIRERSMRFLKATALHKSGVAHILHHDRECYVQPDKMNKPSFDNEDVRSKNSSSGCHMT